MDKTNPYVSYYVNQVGHGFPAYSGLPVQHGRGFGQVLGSLFRSAVPLLKRGALALGKKALTTGARVVGDIASGEKLSTSLKDRLKQGAKEVFQEATSTRPAGSSPVARRGRKPRPAPLSTEKHIRKRARRSTVIHSDVFKE